MQLALRPAVARSWPVAIMSPLLLTNKIIGNMS
jgi:hypothetical protein